MSAENTDKSAEHDQEVIRACRLKQDMEDSLSKVASSSHTDTLPTVHDNLQQGHKTENIDKELSEAKEAGIRIPVETKSGESSYNSSEISAKSLEHDDTMVKFESGVSENYDLFSNKNKIAGQTSNELESEDLPELCIVLDLKKTVIPSSVIGKPEKMKEIGPEISRPTITADLLNASLDTVKLKLPLSSENFNQETVISTVVGSHVVEIRNLTTRKKQSSTNNSVAQEDTTEQKEKASCPDHPARKPLLGVRSLRSVVKPVPFVWDVDSEDQEEKQKRNERTLRAFRQQVQVAPFSWDSSDEGERLNIAERQQPGNAFRQELQEAAPMTEISEELQNNKFEDNNQAGSSTVDAEKSNSDTSCTDYSFAGSVVTDNLFMKSCPSINPPVKRDASARLVARKHRLSREKGSIEEEESAENKNLKTPTRVKAPATTMEKSVASKSTLAASKNTPASKKTSKYSAAKSSTILPSLTPTRPVSKISSSKPHLADAQTPMPVSKTPALSLASGKGTASKTFASGAKKDASFTPKTLESAKIAESATHPSTELLPKESPFPSTEKGKPGTRSRVLRRSGSTDKVSSPSTSRSTSRNRLEALSREKPFRKARSCDIETVPIRSSPSADRVSLPKCAWRKDTSMMIRNTPLSNDKNNTDDKNVSKDSTNEIQASKQLNNESLKISPDISMPLKISTRSEKQQPKTVSPQRRRRRTNSGSLTKMSETPETEDLSRLKIRREVEAECKKKKEDLTTTTIAKKEKRVQAERKPLTTKSRKDMDIGTSKSKRELDIETDKPMSSKSKKELYIESDKPVSCKNKKELDIETDKPMSSKSKKELYIETEKPVSCKSKKGLDIETDKPMSSKSKNELDIETGKPVSSKSKKELNTETFKPLCKKSKTKLDIETDKPVSSKSKKELDDSKVKSVPTRPKKEPETDKLSTGASGLKKDPASVAGANKRRSRSRLSSLVSKTKTVLSATLNKTRMPVLPGRKSSPNRTRTRLKPHKKTNKSVTKSALVEDRAENLTETVKSVHRSRSRNAVRVPAKGSESIKSNTTTSTETLPVLTATAASVIVPGADVSPPASSSSRQQRSRDSKAAPHSAERNFALSPLSTLKKKLDMAAQSELESEKRDGQGPKASAEKSEAPPCKTPPGEKTESAQNALYQSKPQKNSLTQYLGAMVRRRKQPISWRSSTLVKKPRMTLPKVPQFELIRVEPAVREDAPPDHRKTRSSDRDNEPPARTVHTRVTADELKMPTLSGELKKWSINRHLTPKDIRKKKANPKFPFSFQRAGAAKKQIK